MRKPDLWSLAALLAALLLGPAEGGWARDSTDPPVLPEAAAEPEPRGRVSYDGGVSLALTAGALVSVALPLEIYKTPPACRWCGGSDPNFLDRWARKARWDEPCKAGRLSYLSLGATGALALIPMSHESSSRAWMENTGVVADSVAATVILTQVVKYAVRRERPASDPCHPDQPMEADRNLSFFSGHTAVAFALVSSAHETARLRGRSVDNWLWAGAGAAALTGYFRVGGDRHHLTDVLVGAGVGYAVGRWVPRHLHQRDVAGPGASGRGVSPPAGPPAFAYARSMGPGGDVLVRVGKGPGKSLVFRVDF